MGFGELIRCEALAAMNLKIGGLALVIAASVSLSGCHVYWASDIEGKVVDGQSGKPVEGASVTAVWDIYGGLAHGSRLGPMLVRETTTNADGGFLLPGWGPKVVLWNGLHVAAPTLIVAHQDYYLQLTHHEHSADAIVPPSFSIEERHCECGEREISLAKLDGDLSRYQENAEVADRNFAIARGADECQATEAPAFAREMLRRSAELTKKGAKHSLPTHTC
jgi:hypothetical protein